MIVRTIREASRSIIGATAYTNISSTPCALTSIRKRERSTMTTTTTTSDAKSHTNQKSNQKFGRAGKRQLEFVVGGGLFAGGLYWVWKRMEKGDLEAKPSYRHVVKLVLNDKNAIEELGTDLRVKDIIGFTRNHSAESFSFSIVGSRGIVGIVHCDVFVDAFDDSMIRHLTLDIPSHSQNPGCLIQFV